MNKKYKEPILATIYKLIGLLVPLPGLLIGIASIVNDHDEIGIAIVLGNILVGAFLYGIGQMMSCVAKSAHFAESIDDQIRKAISSGATPVTPKKVVLKKTHNDTTPCPSCKAEMYTEDLRAGINTCTVCNSKFTH